MKVETVAVRHPSNPERRILVNVSDVDNYVAWEREPDVEAPAPEGADVEAEEAFAGEDGPMGYRVEESRGWYKLIRNADDEQVGKSVRSEDEAWAQMEDED